MDIAFLEETRIINERLDLLYGRNVNVNKANFRLVMAGDCLEKRDGELHYGDIFLKTAVKQVKKYAWLEDNQWVVERLVPNVLQDVIEGNYSYEPIYAFPPGIYPIWRAIEFMLFNLFNPHGPKTQKELDYREAERMEREKKRTRDMLDTTVLETSLNDGNAISYSNTEGIDYRPSQQLRIEHKDVLGE